MKKCLRFLASAVLFITLFAAAAGAEEAIYHDTTAEVTGFSSSQNILDGSRYTYSSAGESAAVTLTRKGGIASLYIEFDRLPSPWTLTDPATGTRVTCGTHTFLHEFVDVSALFGGLPETLTLSFPMGVVIADLYAFSAGDLPDWVQVWEPPCVQADLLLLSSHSDDEQLFFAGVLPYYATERQLSVQVAYVVQHFEAYGAPDHQRPHEQLDGLWTVGVRNYPYMSYFPDLYSESKDRATAFAAAQKVYEAAGFTYEDFVNYITLCIRKFKPLVVVSHDLDGEYGHGTHVYAAAALTDAIEYAADPEKFPEHATEYGTWTVEKTYLHLYPENQITMDWDTPLDSLGGKTPFEVTQDGFGCHASQHWTWFKRWIYGREDAPITRASQIKSYSPCSYGLYRSEVGPDVIGGDFFENVETYAQRAARTEAEAEAARLQAEAEAAAKAQAEAEAAAKAQAEAQAQAQAEAKAQAEAEALRQAHSRRIALSVGIAITVILAAGVLFVSLRHKKTANR